MDAATFRQRLRGNGREALRDRLEGGVRPRGRTGQDTLFGARYACYLLLGFEEEQAFFLAMTPDVAVLDALRLIEDDCPHELVASILA